MSDGPLITVGLDMNNDLQDEFICGDEAMPDAWQYLDSKIHLKIANTDEFGDIQECKLILGSQNGEHVFMINAPSAAQLIDKYLSLDSIVAEMESSDTIQDWEYFYVRAEIKTHKNFAPLSALYRDTAQDYHSLTNPLWIKKPAIIVGTLQMENQAEIKCYPNPFIDEIHLYLNLYDPSTVKIEILDLTGRIVNQEFLNGHSGEQTMSIATGKYANGIYTLHITGNGFDKCMKIIKINDF
jgi:hypothetical protein